MKNIKIGVYVFIFYCLSAVMAGHLPTQKVSCYAIPHVRKCTQNGSALRKRRAMQFRTHENAHKMVQNYVNNIYSPFKTMWAMNRNRLKNEQRSSTVKAFIKCEYATI